MEEKNGDLERKVQGLKESLSQSQKEKEQI